MISPAIERATRLAWPMNPPSDWLAYMRFVDVTTIIGTAAEPYATQDDISWLHWLGETARSLYLEEIRRG